MRPGLRRYLNGSVLLAVAYTALAGWFAATMDFSDEGPLGPGEPAMTEPLPGGIGEHAIREICAEEDLRLHVVAAQVDGIGHYACYRYDGDSLYDVRVIRAADGSRVTDVGVLRRAGAWTSIGVVKTRGELLLGGAGTIAILVFGRLYYRIPRPGAPVRAPWWADQQAVRVLSWLPLVGWLVLTLLPGVSRARKIRAGMQIVWGIATFFIVLVLLLSLSTTDPWGIPVSLLLTVTLGYAGIAGRLWVAPAGFGTRERARTLTTSSPPAPPERVPRSRRELGASLQVATLRPPMPSDDDSELVRVQSPDRLPTFAAVGGMDAVKREFEDTFGLLLAFAGKAREFRITWNGVLLHGSPGTGKTFLAKAVAGEYGLNLLHVSTGDLVTAYRGESATNVKRVFRQAARNVPCLLFFDEFDSVAQERSDAPDQEGRRTVNQLLQSLEEYRGIRELVVMAATNHMDGLDRAITRPGRFDRKIRVDLPDREARAAIFAAQLRPRPVDPGVDVAELARRTDGLTPAAITQLVEAAALRAFRECAGTGVVAAITMTHLTEAIGSRGGPLVEDWGWDRVVLPPAVKRELQQLQLVVENPERAAAFGVNPPSGVLLTGPPGTGKTMIARVLAAEAKCSFYPVSAADVTSKWLGESEQLIRRLFQRAQENRPSIVFIDEIDAIASRRGSYGTYDRQVNELLTAMDGIGSRPGVLVLAATNRKDQLDPAVTRGGRLSRTIEIPLPDFDARFAILKIMSARMPTIGVSFTEVAMRTEGMSGADLEALCQQAALCAMIRKQQTGANLSNPAVRSEDFEQALGDIREPSPR